MSAKPAIRSEIDTGDIQALAWTAFDSLKGGSYMLLRINDPGATREWLRSLTPTSLGDLYGADGAKQTRDEVVQVAFTAPGLKALGMPAGTECRNRVGLEPLLGAKLGKHRPDVGLVRGEQQPVRAEHVALRLSGAYSISRTRI